MSELYAEVGIAQLSKKNEELCGDNVGIVRTPEATIIVLSDGLGSGVKANILATLTTKIALSMLKRGIPLEDVVETIAETLPVCKQRKIAYSTLHILKIRPTGKTTVVEFDCPRTLLFRAGKAIPFPTEEEWIAGKKIRKGRLFLQEQDCLVAVSDGVIHAGIGGLLPLGWGWEGFAEYFDHDIEGVPPAQAISQNVINACEGYYVGEPGDDTTCVAVRLRSCRKMILFTGPPGNPDDDRRIVKRFMAEKGMKAIAGGTTANIVSRCTGEQVHVDLTYYDSKVPPTAQLAGVDLVTEGVLTLNGTIERLMAGQYEKGKDGASRLAKMLMDADQISILAGMAINPAHQNPNFPMPVNLKTQLISKLQTILERKGKEVFIEWV